MHVAGMLNTAEVASEMYISVNTVKTHLKNIYRKLAAAHRSEAVRRAPASADLTQAGRWRPVTSFQLRLGRARGAIDRLRRAIRGG